MASSVTSNDDRFVRQKDLVPMERLAPLLMTVIGVGSIGRQVARTLACIGARRMQLVDFDRVEDSNRTTQGYLVEDVGQPKVTAMSREIARIDPRVDDHPGHCLALWKQCRGIVPAARIVGRHQNPGGRPIMGVAFF
jgi:sulfur carrier protein ThiS adenylyltransferase